MKPDISWAAFAFYEDIKYLEYEGKYPDDKEKKGKFIGVAHNVGDFMTFKVRDENGNMLVRSVVRSAHEEEDGNYEIDYDSMTQDVLI